jgi:hypothetical protein
METEEKAIAFPPSQDGRMEDLMIVIAISYENWHVFIHRRVRGPSVL